MIRPNGAVESVFVNQTANEMSERIIDRPIPPSSLVPGTTADRQGGSMMWTYPGLKPRAQSCHPFAISPTGREGSIVRTFTNAPGRATTARRVFRSSVDLLNGKH